MTLNPDVFLAQAHSNLTMALEMKGYKEHVPPLKVCDDIRGWVVSCGLYRSDPLTFDELRTLIDPRSKLFEEMVQKLT